MPLNLQPPLHVFESEAWTQSVAHSLAERVARRLNSQDRFNLALTGGSTPREMYRTLGTEPLRSNVDWRRVHIFFGDERAVGPEHPDSNFRMASQAWLAASAIPPEHIHRMEGENPELDRAAQTYEALLRKELPADESGWPRFDLILLGMGDDGHTASLFPGTRALAEAGRAVVANEVPQMKTHRLTLTFPALDAAREVWFLVTGAGKAARVAQALGYTPADPPLPCSLVRPTHGELHWWLDRAAAAALPPGTA